MSPRWWLLFSAGLVLVALLSGGCVGASGAEVHDAAAPGNTWDGHCYGRPGDDGKRAVWLHTVYVCRDNGKGTSGWFFVQDPEYYGVRVR